MEDTKMKKFLCAAPLLFSLCLLFSVTPTQAQYYGQPQYGQPYGPPMNQVRENCPNQFVYGRPASYENMRCRWRIVHTNGLIDRNGYLIATYQSDPCFVQDPYCGQEWAAYQMRYDRQYWDASYEQYRMNGNRRGGAVWFSLHRTPRQ